MKNFSIIRDESEMEWGFYILILLVKGVLWLHIQGRCIWKTRDKKWRLIGKVYFKLAWKLYTQDQNQLRIRSKSWLWIMVLVGFSRKFKRCGINQNSSINNQKFRLRINWDWINFLKWHRTTLRKYFSCLRFIWFN